MCQDRITIKNVSKAFASRSILKEINVSFSSGQVVGILGANGSGKTTLIKLMCGLVYPDEGSILINGLDIASNRFKIMSDLGVLLDGSRGLYWRLSAWQNFVYFSGLKGKFGKSVKEQGKYLFTYFGLSDKRDQKVESFSLGMKQKLSICCALSHGPNVILLDEPTIGLDCEAQELLMRLIKSKAVELKTILIASHDVEMLNNICDQKFTICNGSIFGLKQ